MRYEECKRAAKAFARANGHRMGRWTDYAVSECVLCGTALVASDAVDWVERRDMFYLGTLAYECPRAVALQSSDQTTNAA